MEEVIFNKCQTPLDELELNNYPQEVQESFFDFLNNVPFIKWMVSPKRPLISELPRDEEGRAIIDITHPPILENTSFFRETVQQWQETGQYCHLRPNPNPNSDFGRWLKEERRRCWEGYIDPSTGMWITGDYYYMLNYCPMHLVEKMPDGLEIRTTAPPKFWDGQFLASHYMLQARLEKHHAAELASRGKGKTSLGAAMLTKRFIFGETEKNRREAQCLVTAADRTKLIGTNQILSVFKDNIDFAAKTTPFPGHRLKSSVQELVWIAGFKKSDSLVEYGSKNSVSGIVSGVNQDKLNGSRGVLYIIEEAGIFKDLREMYNLIRPSVEQGTSVFGELVLYGTAGNEQSDFAAFQEMLYSPDGYNILAVDNVFDKEGQGRTKFAWFYGAYMNYDDSCIDKDGNSDVTKALLNICYDRYKVKYGSSDINTITKRISQYPITPQEAIIRSQGNVFPVTELNERLNQIDSNPNEYDDVYVGELTIEGNEVKFVPTVDLPIREFPTKDNKVKGALEIYNMPQKNPQGKVPADRYGIGVDTFDDDQSNTMSLGSILVMDFWTDTICAEYTGRPDFANDFYEMARRLCIFYNAKALYESNLKGIYGYFSSLSCTYLLADTPEYLRDRQLVSSIGYGNKSKGVRAGAPIIKYAFSLIRDWLKKPVPKIEKDADGNDIEVKVPNLYNLRNRALIKELIQWNPQGNYDRIMALVQLVLYREEKIILFQGDTRRGAEISSGMENDDYWSKNYPGQRNAVKKFNMPGTVYAGKGTF